MSQKQELHGRIEVEFPNKKRLHLKSCDIWLFLLLNAVQWMLSQTQPKYCPWHNAQTSFVPIVRSLSIAHGNKLKMFLDCTLLYKNTKISVHWIQNCAVTHAFHPECKLHCSAFVSVRRQCRMSGPRRLSAAKEKVLTHCSGALGLKSPRQSTQISPKTEGYLHLSTLALVFANVWTFTCLKLHKVFNWIWCTCVLTISTAKYFVSGCHKEQNSDGHEFTKLIAPSWPSLAWTLCSKQMSHTYVTFHILTAFAHIITMFHENVKSRSRTSVWSDQICVLAESCKHCWSRLRARPAVSAELLLP